MRKKIKQPHLLNSKPLLLPPLPPQHPPPLPPNLPQHPPRYQHQHQHPHPQHTRKKQNPSPHPPKPPTTSSQAQPLAPPPRQKRRKVKRLQQLPRQRRRLTRKAMRRIGNKKHPFPPFQILSCGLGVEEELVFPRSKVFGDRRTRWALLGNFGIFLVWNGEEW